MGDDFENAKQSLNAQLSDEISRLETAQASLQQSLNDIQDLITSLETLNGEMQAVGDDKLADEQAQIQEAISQLQQALADIEDAVSLLESVYLPTQVEE